MDRREVLKRILVSAASMTALSTILSSCKKSNWSDDPAINEPATPEKVIVIGAGAAGLYAAYLLDRANIDVTILEASDRIGGRVRTLENFTDVPIETGAEEIRGEDSILYQIAQASHATLLLPDLTTYLMLDNFLRTESEITSDPDYVALNQFIDNFYLYNGADITVYDYAQLQAIAIRVNHLLEARIGNDYGASNRRISAKWLANAQQLWSSGDSNYLVQNAALLPMLANYMVQIIPKVRLNVQIKSINYESDSIQLTDARGSHYTATRVIITVPLPVLRDGDITFYPALPSTKLAAMNQIGMGAGMKIFLKFSNRFWEPDSGAIYSDGFVPIYYPVARAGGSAARDVLTAYVAGEKAEYLSNLGSGAIQVILNELDRIFGPGAASQTLIGSHIADWGKDPYIRGAFSYPIIGEGDARVALGEAVNDKLFFAGEATHSDGQFGTVHGALETGERAVTEIQEAIAGK